jgi:hypothetical protein
VALPGQPDNLFHHPPTHPPVHHAVPSSPSCLPAWRGPRGVRTCGIHSAAEDVPGQLVEHLGDRATEHHQQLLRSDLAHRDAPRVHDEGMDRAADGGLVRPAARPVHALARRVDVVVRGQLVLLLIEQQRAIRRHGEGAGALCGAGQALLADESSAGLSLPESSARLDVGRRLLDGPT